VNENEIGVAVKEGVVTLMGRRASCVEKLAAQEAAHRVAGVLDVATTSMCECTAASRAPTKRSRKRCDGRWNGTMLVRTRGSARR
jgi:hypothetical protein